MNNLQDPSGNRDAPWDNPRFRNWISVLRAEKAVVRLLSRELAPLGLKIAQLDLLMNLRRHPGASQHEIAKRLLVGRSNVTMLLPSLEKDGLVLREPDPGDKRAFRLSLTQAGEKLLDQALKIYTAIIDRVMAQSSPAECDQMGELMRRIVDELREDRAG